MIVVILQLFAQRVFYLARTAAQIQAEITKLESARDKILDGGQDLGRGDKRLIRARFQAICDRLDKCYSELSGVQYGAGARNVGLLKRS